jgi:ribosomal protein L40E
VVLNPSSLGRTGGIVVAVFGGALIVGVVAMLGGADVAIDRYGAIPLAMLTFGGAAVLAGVVAIRSAGPVAEQRMPKSAARELVGRTRIPFGVCTACHAVLEGHAVGCRECGSLHDWVQVDAERERTTALAALGAD